MQLLRILRGTLAVAATWAFLAVSFVIMLPFFLVALVCGGWSMARRWVGYPAGAWVVFPGMAAIAEWWGGSTLRVHTSSPAGAKSPDAILVPGESALVMANHVFALDWWAIMRLGVRIRSAGWLVFLAKDSVKYIPVVGWVVAMAGVLLRRSWDLDAARLFAAFRAAGAAGQPVWLMCHPEGTRMSPAKLAASQAWLEAQGRDQMDHVLAPRVKAVIAAVAALHSRFAAIYDLTLAYPDGTPSIWKVACSCAPDVHLHVDRIPIPVLFEQIAAAGGLDAAAVPDLFDATASGDATAAAVILPLMKEWVRARWQLKERRLREFHARGGQFDPDEARELPLPSLSQHGAFVRDGLTRTWPRQAVAQ
ncbi:1-acylglycerol-3-phosphate acyltransferase [Thecamonas trahens ATCC 50062]|uniref:1-acylglycerol-3-phosphate acyltransferase n=1 Tax=Thecamonas trahens ATCC 50062 TaxID=461836 RepID=A0A0L0D6I8_THETB|nr:1-acylglycerol-3-phosphate acyltransferase [Thecamonas trahens ATCC 50062]KNC47686.1 1-acylglycerol-3-phosphate acyltransferase [Thecamonas trahens ATCC 50062]|eukprot:XP_013759168.1 1-acylglycerol-3-phosphate acyltransferase [Thecamonas trahens ATCC 50062]